MDHDCIFQETIIDTVADVAALKQSTENTSEKIDNINDKLDTLIEEIQSLKIQKATDSFIQKAMKTAAVFLIALVSNIFWTNIAGFFHSPQ